MFLKVLYFVVASTLAVTSSADELVVNEFFDRSLEDMCAELKDNTGGYVDLGTVSAGGYDLEGATMGDLSVLKRHGNVSMSSEGEVITIVGYVELSNMIIKGGNITSLDTIITNPVITFSGFEGFRFESYVKLSIRTCENSYMVQRVYWSRGTVHLTSDSEQYTDIDITQLVKFHEDEISEPLSDALANVFGTYFGFCHDF